MLITKWKKLIWKGHVLYGSNSDILKKAKQSDSDKSLDAGVRGERGVTTQDSEDV